MKKFLPYLAAITIPAVLMAGCQQPPGHPLYTPSSAAAPVDNYASFSQYLSQTEQYLAQHRFFVTDNPTAELKANMPSELQPTTPDGAKARKGILLIHGLGDSPWSFSDIGPALADQGFLVRTVLLPGHGSRPADMIDVSHTDWLQLVAKQLELLKQDVDNVYLGGFSTGGNLAYLVAAQDSDVQGLMLFSPGFKSDEPLAGLTPLLAMFKEWLLTTDPERVTNYARYSAMPTNGFAQYAYTSSAVLEHLNQQPYEKPVMMVLTEHDSVLDTREIRTLFDNRFSHPDSRLIWFGTEPEGINGRTRTILSHQPELRISTMSHMGLLFSPDNSYYGINGSERLCNNGQTEAGEQACRDGKQVWYSAWGHQEPSKVHARLTFNPAFEVMMSDIRKVFSSTGPANQSGNEKLAEKRSR